MSEMRKPQQLGGIRLGGGSMGGGIVLGGGPGGAGGRPGQKAKNFNATFKRFAGYFISQKYILLMVLVITILSTIFNILGPKILGLAITILFQGMAAQHHGKPGTIVDFSSILHLLALLTGLYVIGAIFSYMQQYIMAGIAQKVVYRLRKEMDEKLARLPLQYVDTHAHGEIMSRAINDIDTISTTLQQSLTQLLIALVTSIGVVIMMLTISPLLSLVIVLTLPPSIFVTTVIARRSQAYFMAQQKALGQLNEHVEEMYTGHPVVKAFGLEHYSIAEFDDLNIKLYHASWKAQFVSSAIMPIMMFIGNLGYVFVSVVGSIMVANRALAIGDVLAFIQYARQFTMPITQVATITNVIQSTIAASERIFEFLDAPEEVPDPDVAQAIEHPQGAIQFEHVTFRYKEDIPLIEDLQISIKQGQKIALVGPTGAGKTTLVNLLMRFYEVKRGKILIDGIESVQMQRGELRRLFSMVLQDTWLFHGTIRDNIAYGREDATDDEIIQAATIVHADHFIRTLPAGYQTMINQNATNLSQGQKQLLTIARALLSNAPILLLDEATSSVDTRTEIAIQKAMDTLMRGRTCFVIAHRLSTIQDADGILVLNHGSIVEQGTHEELLAAQGLYANLYHCQFANEELELT